MNKITRLSKNEFETLLTSSVEIGRGSESIVYDLKNGFVLKDLMDNELMRIKAKEDVVYKEDDLLKFSDVNVKSYFFTKGVVYSDKDLRGCILKKCDGYELTYIDPLSVNLSLLLSAIDKFIKDTKLISDKHILTYDMPCNIMFNGVSFGAIDTIHYNFSDDDEQKIFNKNINCFNLEVLDFLTDLYFKNFVIQNKELNETYKAFKNGEYTNLVAYIKLLIKKLSEYCDKKIIYLRDADKAIMENLDPSYPAYPIHKLKK